jgi:hypothetical protein
MRNWTAFVFSEDGIEYSIVAVVVSSDNNLDSISSVYQPRPEIALSEDSVGLTLHLYGPLSMRDGIIYGADEKNLHLLRLISSAVLLLERYLRLRIRLRAFFGIHFSRDVTGDAVPDTFTSNYGRFAKLLFIFIKACGKIVPLFGQEIGTEIFNV